MRTKRLSLVLLCAMMAFAALPAARQALAEDDQDTIPACPMC